MGIYIFVMDFVMESMPLVSVIIPTYNGEKYIRDSLCSVLKQNYPNMEVLVLDDGSQDNTPDLLKCLKQEWDTKDQIKIILDKKNKGIPKNMNLGLNESSGKYIAVLDQDDIRIDPDKTFKQVDFLEKNTDHGMVGTNVIINKKGQIFQNKFPINDNLIRKVILGVSCFQHSSVVYKKDLALDIGGYSNKYNYTMDYKLFLDILREAKAGNLSDFTVCYNLHGNNFSRSNCTAQSKQLLDISRSNRKYFPMATKAMIFRIGNFLSSSCLGNNNFYEIMKLYIKNNYQSFGSKNY